MHPEALKLKSAAASFSSMTRGTPTENNGTEVKLGAIINFKKNERTERDGAAKDQIIIKSEEKESENGGGKVEMVAKGMEDGSKGE